MNSKYRLVLLTVAALLSVGVLVSLSGSAFVGSDWAKQYLMQKLASASGRRFDAEKLVLQLTPKLHIDATGLRVSNPDWARASPDFLRVESGSFEIALLPLLIGRIRIERAEMDGVELFLERSGTANNWNFKSAAANAADAARQADATMRASWVPDHASIRRLAVQYRGIDGETTRWQLPLSTLRAAAGREVQADMQVLAENRAAHLILRADNVSDFGKSGARTMFVLHAEAAGQTAAGSVHAAGLLGLGADLAGTDLRINIDAPPKSPLLALMGLGGRDLAAIKLDFALHERAGSMEIAELAFSLGDFHMTGQGVFNPRQSPLRIEGQLRSDYLDWRQMRQDIGLPPLPAKPAGALFRDLPLAWPLLQRVNGFTADLGLQLGVLKLLSGVPLQNVKMQVQLQADQMRVPAFSADFLGGATTADAVFTAHDQQVKLRLKASGVSIAQWRSVMHKPMLVSGGPLAVDANVSANGASMQKLAATLTGPVSLRMGRAIVRSSRASEAESLLTGLIPVLAGKRAERMDVVCVVASLPFKNGRATASSIAGARTESSQLLTDGEVDLRDQTLDLHGRVTGVNGIRLGVSAFVGDVNISGKLLQPKFQLDRQGLFGTAARIGAAILSGGLTVVGTTLWDAYADDACKVAVQHPESKPPARAAPR